MQMQLTSLLARDSLDDDKLARLELACLSVIFPGGATCDECETVTGLSHQTASARLRALVLKGKIHDGGTKRPTRSGRSAIVWQTGPQPATP